LLEFPASATCSRSQRGRSDGSDFLVPLCSVYMLRSRPEGACAALPCAREETLEEKLGRKNTLRPLRGCPARVRNRRPTARRCVLTASPRVLPGGQQRRHGAFVRVVRQCALPRARRLAPVPPALSAAVERIPQASGKWGESSRVFSHCLLRSRVQFATRGDS
jgi:hypothetical protein